jgi:hypothetical protein
MKITNQMKGVPMKQLVGISLTLLLILTTACTKSNPGTTPAPPTLTVESTARDVAAGLSGVLVGAQAQFHTQCTAPATGTATPPPICHTINQAGGALNTLITATEAYCGWQAGTVPASNPTAPVTVACVPVTTAQAGLTAAITNAQSFITSLKSAF